MAVPANPVQPIVPSSAHQDQYDFENRLIKRASATESVTIVYDGDGNRVWKVISRAPVLEQRCYLVDERSPSGYPFVPIRAIGVRRVRSLGIHLFKV